METLLRAIEMSDSSSLGINPALAAEVCDVHGPVRGCISALSFVCVHTYASRKENLFINVRSAVGEQNSHIPVKKHAVCTKDCCCCCKLTVPIRLQTVLIYSTFQH